MIECINEIAIRNGHKRIKFRNSAIVSGQKYSRFFRENTVIVEDAHAAEDISEKFGVLIGKFSNEIHDVGSALENFVNSEESSPV